MEECIICFEETTEFMFYNCVHKVCTHCYPKIKNCPMCNTPKTLQIEVQIVQPINQITTVRQINSTYNFIRCFGSILIVGAFGLYFYNDK